MCYYDDKQVYSKIALTINDYASTLYASTINIIALLILLHHVIAYVYIYSFHLAKHLQGRF